MVRTRISCIALCAALAPLGALAQEASDSVTLDPVLPSGGLFPIVADAYGRAHTVLTAEEIEEHGIRSVQDALHEVPGVAVNSTGSSFTQVRIRGAEANHTLILIDGVPATGGNDEYILTGLETANIERIEVLRGPQSVYFGSNASAGVVNIITRKARPAPITGARSRRGTAMRSRAGSPSGATAAGWPSRPPSATITATTRR